MSKAVRRSTPAGAPENLGLNAFQRQVGDQGMSLENAEDLMRVTNPRSVDPYQHEPDPGDEPLELPPEFGAGDGQDPCPLNPQSILEAILFVGHPENEPISPRYVAALMRGVRPAEIEDLVAELNAAYAAEHSPFTIEGVGNGYRLTLDDIYMSLRESFHGKVKEARLSQVAIDTLAVVAYRQPISWEELRKAYDEATPRIVAQLVRRGLVGLQRTSERSGVAIYRTTPRFLEIFGLKSLDDLPRGQDAELD